MNILCNKQKIELEIVNLVKSFFGDISEIVSISIIGSYLYKEEIRPGSDIDIVICVDDIHNTSLKPVSSFYKDAVLIKDAMGERIEFNVGFHHSNLDITLMSEFNEMNNPSRDNYENALGSIGGSKAIYGQPLRHYFCIDQKMLEYQSVRTERREKLLLKLKTLITQYSSKSYSSVYHVNYILNLYFKLYCIERNVFPQYEVKNIELLDIDDVEYQKYFGFMRNDSNSHIILAIEKNIQELFST